MTKLYRTELRLGVLRVLAKEPGQWHTRVYIAEAVAQLHDHEVDVDRDYINKMVELGLLVKERRKPGGRPWWANYFKITDLGLQKYHEWTARGGY